MEEFRLGSRTLQPHRQLLADGEHVQLGKRALDIVSVLAEAKGEIVTKDELLEVVWPGVIVEENALQVHIVALRKALGPEAERLRTIRGVGYQLDLSDRELTLDRATAMRWPFTKFRLRRAGKQLAYLALAGILALGGVGIYAWLSPRPAEAGEVVRVDRLQVAGGAGAQSLALAIQGSILDVLNQSGIQAFAKDGPVPSTEETRATRALGGTVTQSGGRMKAHLVLTDTPSGATLWSKQFEGDLASDRLATETAVAAARTIYSVRELYLQDGLELDPVSIALHIRSSELIRSAEFLQEGAPRELIERFVARAPNSAHGHGLLAMAWINEARRGPPEARPALFAKSRSEALKAIAISEAAAGAGYDALYLMLRIQQPREWVKAEDLMLDSLGHAPRFPFLLMRQCRLLTDVGRARDALSYCQRALALHPFAEPIGHSYARALHVAGDAKLARDAIERFAHLYPDHGVTKKVRFELAAFGGNPDFALALLNDPATAPREVRGDTEQVLRNFLQVRSQLPAQQDDDLTDQIMRLGLRGEMPIDWAVMALAELGKHDEAFGLLRSPRLNETLFTVGSSFLFQPATAPLRADPRFWRSAAELGLAKYWVARGKWPDMCEAELELAACKVGSANSLAAPATKLTTGYQFLKSGVTPRLPRLRIPMAKLDKRLTSMRYHHLSNPMVPGTIVASSKVRFRPTW